MRYESSVVSVSWIPSEAVRGLTRLTFEAGLTHYDQAPPAQVCDLETLRSHDGFRFANELAAWIEVQDGRIVDFGQGGDAHMGSTTVKLGRLHRTFAGVTSPTLRREPEVGDGWVRFVQTAGGRTALPFPRLSPHAPFVHFRPPTAWTTLALTLFADGRVERELIGASPFPRHFVYDADGQLVAKSGVIRFGTWARHALFRRSPWHHVEHRPLVAPAESPVERQLSGEIMRGGRTIRHLHAGEVLVDQGAQSEDVFLVLDGVLTVEVDGRLVGEVGPGAVVGERAVVEGGPRTAAVRALTPVRVAVTSGMRLERPALAAVVDGHRREEALV